MQHETPLNISDLGLPSLSLHVLSQVSRCTTDALQMTLYSHLMLASVPRGRAGI